MAFNLLTSCIITISVGTFVWICNYLLLPFWLCLLCSALIYTTPQNNLTGLATTLFTGLLGILLGTIYFWLEAHIPIFPYRIEITVAVIVCILYLITQLAFFKNFTCALITLSLLVLNNGNWMSLCQIITIGTIYGFMTRLLISVISSKKGN